MLLSKQAQVYIAGIIRQHKTAVHTLCKLAITPHCKLTALRLVTD